MTSPSPAPNRAIGRVKWFDCRKGFGFLVGSDGGDVFVHYTVIEDTGFRRLKDGEAVEYESILSPKGFLATWARRKAEQAADPMVSPPDVTTASADVPGCSSPDSTKGGLP